MTQDRLDALLDQALEIGAIPDGATPEERAELEPLLARAGAFRLNAARVASEADASLPTARARIQRHLAEQRPASQAPVSPLRSPKRGILGRWFGGGAMTFASSAAALAVIAVVAILVLQPFGGVETASALTVDDYVQVQGVVSATSDGAVTVQSSELGNLEVALSDLTAVTDDAGARNAASLKPGDPVLVSGVVTAKRAIAASNVAVAQNQAAPTPVGERKIPILKDFRQGLQGSVALVALSPDGKRARVLLVMRNESLLVDVDPRSMDQFLAGSPRAVGALVRVVDAPDLPKGVFRLQPVDPPPASPTAPAGQPPAPQFQGIKGVVTERKLNVLMVKTDRGIVPVVIQLGTAIRFGDSGLTPDDIRAGERVVGYEVSVSGNLEEPTGRRVIASIIVVLGKAPAK